MHFRLPYVGHSSGLKARGYVGRSKNLVPLEVGE